MSKIGRNFKYHALSVIFMSVLFVLFIASFNYVVDPLQIYRKQSFVEPRFYTDQRFQNAGKINSYLSSDNYEAIIVGHSQMDNFIPSEVQNFLNLGKVIKLTIDDSTPREQYLMVSKALEKGEMKLVLWGIGHTFSNQNPLKFNDKRFFPDYLYSASIVDDQPYLLSLDIFNFSIELLLSKSDWSSDLNTLNYWMPKQVKNYESFSSEKKLKKFKKILEKRNVKHLKKISEIQLNNFPNVEINLLPLIQKYPDVKFILIFPPFYYLYLADYHNYHKWLSLQKSVVEATANHPNVKVFGFGDNSVIGGNIANYRDMLHYHSGVNMFMLESIKDDHNRLTCLNFKEYESNVRANILDFRIYSNFTTMVPLAFPQEHEKLFAILRSKRAQEQLDNALKLYKNKKFSEAENQLNMIINTVGVNNKTVLRKAHYFRGKTFMQMGKIDTAIHDFTKVLEINPEFAWAHICRGDAFLRINKMKAAEEDFERFIALQPGHFRGYWLLGKLISEKGEFAAAIRLLTKAIELNTQNSRLYRDRADIYAKMGSLAQSEADIQKSMHLNCEAGLTVLNAGTN